MSACTEHGMHDETQVTLGRTSRMNVKYFRFLDLRLRFYSVWTNSGQLVVTLTLTLTGRRIPLRGFVSTCFVSTSPVVNCH